MHGGAAPQVKAAADRVTLASLVGPALVRLAAIIDDPDTPAAAAVAAIREVLSRVAYGEALSQEQLIDGLQTELERLLAEADVTGAEADEQLLAAGFRPRWQ
jgi:hypothetical protein